MHKMLPLALGAVLLFPVSLVQAQSKKKPLDIYFIDTEGGQATLFVSPSGQSLLVDTGFPGNESITNLVDVDPNGITRDADRIMAVLKKANVRSLDYLLISHYHEDHSGNIGELAKRIPIRNYVDHGPFTVEVQPLRKRTFDYYLPLRAKVHTIVPKPGDKIGISGLDVEVVSSAGALISKPIAGAPGAGAANILCAGAKQIEDESKNENFESVGIVVRYGNFRLLDLGDLSWNLEHALVCPNNLLGTLTVFHTTRHGDPHSGPPQLVNAIQARVAVMNNGEGKGGLPEYWQVVHSAPGLEDFWQLHRSAAGGTDHNSPDRFLANINETDHGYGIKLSVREDGSFTMTNERTGFTKEYPVRGR